jgi:hypothetical protein
MVCEFYVSQSIASLHVRILVFRSIVTVLQNLNRLLVRSRRLYEQGVDENRLRQYASQQPPPPREPEAATNFS